MEVARRDKEVAAENQDEQKLAVLQFPQNFDKVSAWAERTGAQRPQDRDAVRKMAKETVYSVMTYASIARSL
jgi:hypothetical protein